MDNPVTGNMDMLDSGYPRGVHDDVRHGCEPGLSATSPCWRLPFIPWYCWFPSFVLVDRDWIADRLSPPIRCAPGT